MKKLLQLVLLSALLIGGLNLSSQTPNIKVDRESDYTLIRILDSYHWPYDISNNKKHIAIQGFGATDSYYWSEETGAMALGGFAFSVSDDGVMAGTFTNSLGYNVAGLWSPETKQWEFLGMNPDVPEYSTVEGDFEYNGAWSMTNDGTKVGVMQVFPDWTTTSYIWSKENGYTKISNGTSPGTRPNAISDDGKIIAGLAVHEDKGEWTPCYWVDGEIYRLPDLFGEALNVSSNGKYICGYLVNRKGFVYDIYNETLIEIENTLEPNFQMSATCVANNGIVFGYSDGGSPSDRKAVVYAGGELMFFNDYLKSLGVEDAENWIVYSINNVAVDGKTFIGAGVIDGKECSFALTVNGAPCAGPTDLTYSVDDEKYDYDDITLSWTAPENADGVTYEIYTSYSAAVPFIDGITETSFVFNDMPAGEYQFFVRANWNDGACISEISNMVKPVVYPCAKKDMCELTIVKADYSNDGWDNGYISIKGSKSDLLYNVKLTTGGDVDNPVVENILLAPDTYTFTWVKGYWDEEVGFTIRFNDEDVINVGINEINADFELTFLEYEISCENETNTVAPTNVAATTQGAYAVKVTWDAAENALSYNVYANNDFVKNVTETECVVEGLQENTEYCFTISSVNGNESELSEQACAKTLEDGVAEYHSSFNIYPNPVNDIIYLESESDVENILIYNIIGNVVFRQQPTDNSQLLMIDVADFNSGVYFVKVRTTNGETIKRFIKK